MTVLCKQMNFFFSGEEKPQKDNTSTFSDNLSLPIHQWFRYSAGFSASWVRTLIEQEKANGRKTVFDPFAGSGTVILEGEFCNVQAIGVEAHPFVARVAQAKLLWRENPVTFQEYALSILERAIKTEGDISGYPGLIAKCFPPETLQRLDSIRKIWHSKADKSSVSELTWLALTSILRECSPVGTAQWQYVLPKKTKSKPTDPYTAFRNKVFLMAEDMRKQQKQLPRAEGKLFQEDARKCHSVPDKFADLVITSPPYINNYDYADATRLEMSFFGEVRGWGDLQEAVRKYLVRSCTQTVSGLNGKLHEILQEPCLEVIRNEITEVCRTLEAEKENHGGKKPYHAMVGAYFSDLAKVFLELRRITTKKSLMCFVIGDSAPYGIYVPVNQWLGKLALAAGFKSFDFEKTRDRNIKWKNRKHRVPLHEGRLWIRG